VAYFYGPPCTCSGGIVQLQVLKSVFDLLPDARVEAVVRGGNVAGISPLAA